MEIEKNTQADMPPCNGPLMEQVLQIALQGDELDREAILQGFAAAIGVRSVTEDVAIAPSVDRFRDLAERTRLINLPAGRA